MNCAEFEHRLAELMAGEGAAGLEELRGHARACGACAVSADLLDWAALPVGERDIAEDPGPEYWAGFNERVRSSLDVRARGSRPVLWWGAAAAALLLLIAGPWIWRQVGVRPADIDETVAGLTVEPPGPPATPETSEMPEELVEMLASPLADELVLGMPWAAALAQDDEPLLGDPVGRGGGLFPDAAGLDDKARRELLEWLRDQALGVSS